MAILQLLSGIKKLKEAWPLINANDQALNADIAAEKASRTNADNELSERISTIVAQAGTGNTEIVDARGGFAALRDRLDAADAQFVNVKQLPFGAKGDGVTDDYTAIANATSYAVDNNKILHLKDGIFGVSKSWKLPPGLRAIFENAVIKLLNASDTGAVITNAWNGGDGVTLATSDVVLINPQADGANIPGENGFGFTQVTGIKVYNPIVKNIKYDAALCGGKAFQTEAGPNTDINVYNPYMENCSIGISVNGTPDLPSTDINFYNVVMHNVDVPVHLLGTNTPYGSSYAHESLSINGFNFRNCGKVTFAGQPANSGGIFCGERGYGLMARGGRIFNDAGYGTVGGLTRGKLINAELDDIVIEADLDALFNGDILRYMAATNNVIPVEVHTENIRHYGALGYVVTAYNTVGGHMANCTLNGIEVADVANTIIDNNSLCQLNNFLSVTRRSDGVKVENMFKPIYDGGNTFDNFKLSKDGFAEIFHVKTNVLDETPTGIFEINMPNDRRAFIEFFITAAYITSGPNAIAAAIHGIATASATYDGTVIATNISTTLESSTAIAGSPTQILTVTLVADTVNDKVTFTVTQNNETGDVAETIAVHAIIHTSHNVIPIHPKVTLL